jgi:hypothetical protein
MSINYVKNAFRMALRPDYYKRYHSHELFHLGQSICSFSSPHGPNMIMQDNIPYVHQ